MRGRAGRPTPGSLRRGQTAVQPWILPVSLPSSSRLVLAAAAAAARPLTLSLSLSVAVSVLLSPFPVQAAGTAAMAPKAVASAAYDSGGTVPGWPSDRKSVA